MQAGSKPKMTSKWSILIVDDELGVRESLRILLKPYYDIFTASDGEAALNIIKEREIHLITLDLSMPKLSGSSCYHNNRVWDPKGCRRGSSLWGEGFHCQAF
jgi:DNA-binding NtrC family response regulator